MYEDEYANELDIRDVMSVLWKSRRIIVFSALIGLALATGYAITLPNIYQSSALLAPTDDSGSDIGGLLSQYGGLASMAGLSLPGSEEIPKAGLALEVLKSRDFTKGFIAKHDILPELLAVDSWDSKTRELVLDSEVYNQETGEWVRDVRAPRKTIPSGQEAFDAFRLIFDVSQDKQSKLVTLSVRHQSPDVAKTWVDLLIKEVNETMRQKEILEAQESIAYLERQIAETSLADLDQVFYELMQSQMQRMMLAQVNREYVLMTIDPAVSPELKSDPQRVLICTVGLVLGVLVGLITALLRHYGRSDVS